MMDIVIDWGTHVLVCTLEMTEFIHREMAQYVQGRSIIILPANDAVHNFDPYLNLSHIVATPK